MLLYAEITSLNFFFSLSFKYFNFLIFISLIIRRIIKFKVYFFSKLDLKIKKINVIVTKLKQ
jgi:hypothetical protein